MRRFLLILLSCLLLTTVSFGADLAASVQSAATVNPDGSCQVTLIAAIHLDQGNDELRFPLPAGAKNIRVNNSRVSTRKTDDGISVNLGKFVGSNAGDFTLTVSYSLPGVIQSEKEVGHVLILPLLSGFEYPVERMDFSVTLPGQFGTKPTFSSGYYQESIESSITYVVSGTTITGYVSQRLQDHETLKMRLIVPDEMLAQSVTSVHHLSVYKIMMGVLAGLALLYWLAAFRSMPLHRIRTAVPPEGITAGELGSRLVHRGADLTMMVVTWAQLGYLIITMDESGRVFLHKRMEMGNERSTFENHYFRNIFRRRPTVDGTSYRYARLCQKAAGEIPGAKSDFLPGAGNPMLFWILCAAMGASAGAAMGGALVDQFVWRMILTVLLAAAGAAGSWLIQKGCMYLHLHDRKPVILALIAIGGWACIGIISGQWPIMLSTVLFQIISGLACAYGGRRSELGKQTAEEILGLRHYLKTIPKEDLLRILKSNPDYYYEMAPYALALGVDKTFAGKFEGIHQPNCSYLMTGIETNHSALEWYPLLREAVEALNARQKRLRFEKFAR